jgi:hypothetical protein
MHTIKIKKLEINKAVIQGRKGEAKELSKKGMSK